MATIRIELAALSQRRFTEEFTRFIDRSIERFQPWVKAQLIDEGRRAAAAYARAGMDAALIEIRKKTYLEFLNRMWVTTVPAAGALVSDALGKSNIDLFMTEALAWLRENAGDRATDMWQVSRVEMQKIIYQGVRDGLTRQQITMAIARARTDVAPERAYRIATTEIHAAANHGSLVAAVDQQVPMTKIWRAMPGARPTHAAASGQEVPLDGLFLVGNAKLPYPGAVGPAKETINCRCICNYVEVGAERPRWLRRPAA